MALTDDEATDAFRFLTRVLRERGLDWVVAQVEEKLAVGKVQAKKLRARDTPEIGDSLVFLGAGRRPPTKRATAVFAVAEQYTAQERLVVRLEAMALAVPTVHSVATDTFATLAEFGAEDDIEFAPETDLSDTYSLSADQIRQTIGPSHQLINLLDELRREVNDAN